MNHPIPRIVEKLKLSKRKAPQFDLFSVLLVVLVAAVLRLYALPNRGLIFWDEAKFSLEGIRMDAGLGSLLGLHTSATLGKAVGSAKPTHALLIGLAYLILGTHDYAALYMNALASTGEVLLTYLIGRRLFSHWTGLIAALFLAVSEYDALYARSALSESDSALLLLAGFYFWLRAIEGRGHGRPRYTGETGTTDAGGDGRPGYIAQPGTADPGDDRRPGYIVQTGSRRTLLFAALLLGVSFTANYRMIVYIAGLVAFDFAWQVLVPRGEGRTASWKQAVFRNAACWAKESMRTWLPGLLLPIAIWAAIDWAAKSRGIQLFHGDITNRNEWYLQQIPYQLHEAKQAVVHFNPLIYLQWYTARQGWFMLLLLFGGFILAAEQRTFRWLCLAAPVLFAYFEYTFAPFIVPRNVVAALPFASVLSAAALIRLAGMIRWWQARRIALAVVTLLTALSGARTTWQLTSMHSGFVDAIHYVERQGSSRVLTGSEIPVFYLRGSGAQCQAPALPLSVSDLSAYIHAGYHFAVLDAQHMSHVTKYIRAHGLLSAQFPAYGNLSLPDDPITSENSDPPGRSRPDLVSVYWLPSLRLPHVASPYPGAIVPCYRDSVT